MHNSLLWLGPARPAFLVLTPACVLLGLACAQWTHGPVNLFEALLVLLGAAAAHVSVNAFNEYLDFRSGLDATTQRTPFSGGSGVLPAHPGLAGLTLAMAVVCLGASIGVGLYFVALRDLALLPLGVAGVALVLAARWYAALTLLAFASLVLGVLAGVLPTGALLGLLTLALALPTVREVLENALDVERLLPAMARNVLVCVLTPVLMATGMWMT